MLALEGFQPYPQCGMARARNLVEIVLDRASFACSPLGLEPPANRLNAADHIDIQAAAVLAGLVGHLITLEDRESHSRR